MKYLSKADTDWRDQKDIYFLLDATPDALRRVLEIMNFVESTKQSFPEICSMTGWNENLGFFLECPQLITALKTRLGTEDLDSTLEDEWIPVPKEFEIKSDYSGLPIGALDVVNNNGISISDDGLYITAMQKGSLARLESLRLDREFIKALLRMPP